MVSYDSILRYICGDKVCREFFSEPNSSPHEVRGAEQLQILQRPPPVWEFLNEATVDSEILATLEQFKDQATDKLLLYALEE